MGLWQDTKRANAQKLIDWLLSVRKDNGWSVDWVNMVAFAELGSSSSHPGMTDSLIMRVLGEMKQNSNTTVDEFETIFNQRLKTDAIAANKQVGCWQFFIPIEVIPSADLAQRNRIRILGREFTFLSFATVERKLDKQSRIALRDTYFITYRTGINVKHLPTVFLSVSTQASSLNLGWRDITPAFDALRGLIELSLDFYGWRITSSEKSARRKLPHPLWMIALKKGTPLELINFITDEDEDTATKPFKLNSTQLAGIKKNAKILRREPTPQSTLSLLADCLRLYSQAMDARFKHFCFLGFWQLAEAITHSETGGCAIVS